MDVSIILVNYKTANLTLNAINSIIEKTKDIEYEIIVVDNSNDYNEFTKLTNLIGDKAKIINANENLGFGKGNNLGVSKSCGDYILFINTDTLLINNAIYELFSYIKTHENVGIVGPNIYTKDMNPNHSYYFKKINLKNEFSSDSIFTLIKKKILGRDDFNKTKNPKKINGFICGACLMIDRNCFNEVGGFDKDIFMYAEDALLCYQVINKCKKEIFNIPSSKIIHFEGGSVNKEISDFHSSMIVDGSYIYFKKIFGEEAAKKILKAKYKINKRKAKLAKLINKKQKATNFKKLSIAYFEKFNKV